MLLIDAVYINNSGGKVLLDYLVDYFETNNRNVFYLFDARCQDSFQTIPTDKKLFLKPSLWQRHRFYIKNKSRFTKVLCFANLPPSIKLNIPVYTYFHNFHYIKTIGVSNLIKFKYIFKKAVLQIFKRNTDEFWVQSDVVAKNFTRKYKNTQTRILPFYHLPSEAKTQVSNLNFLYVSDGNKHKNHQKLLEAWHLINQIFPGAKLHLTISNLYPKLVQNIQAYVQKGVNVLNHGFVPYNKINELYSECIGLVFPSIHESFGLGLVEARNQNCLVFASDLPYVHAIIEPDMVFDPFDEVSISNNIIHFLKEPDRYLSQKNKWETPNQIAEIDRMLNSCAEL